MILDNLESASQYVSAHPLFASAFAYLAEKATAPPDDGRYELGEGLSAIAITGAGKSREQSLAKFESHNQYIDIQYCVSGHETIGWKPRRDCTQPAGGYHAEKDVQFYADAPDTFFSLKAGQFAIFFPDDVHAPMIGEGEIKKLVIKVKCQKNYGE